MGAEAEVIRFEDGRRTSGSEQTLFASGRALGARNGLLLSKSGGREAGVKERLG